MFAGLLYRAQLRGDCRRDCLEYMKRYSEEGKQFDYVFDDLTDIPISRRWAVQLAQISLQLRLQSEQSENRSCNSKRTLITKLNKDLSLLPA